MPLISKWEEPEIAATVAIWKIEEPEDFFTQGAALETLVHHPIHRMEHVAGRYLLKILDPAFPVMKIKIENAGKPVIDGNPLWFSLSHSYPYVAAIISAGQSVGIDLQAYKDKLPLLKKKFLSEKELALIPDTLASLTLAWCAKEAVYKWYGHGKVDFKTHMPITGIEGKAPGPIYIHIDFRKDPVSRKVTVKCGLTEDFGWAITL